MHGPHLDSELGCYLKQLRFGFKKNICVVFKRVTNVTSYQMRARLSWLRKSYPSVADG